MKLLRRDFASLLVASTLTLAGIALYPHFFVAGILSLIGIVTLPGYLFLLLLRVRKFSLAEWLLYSLGLSLLFIMLLGLAANIALPLIGNSHPLGYATMLPAFGLLLGLELIACFFQKRSLKSHPLPYHFTSRKLALGSVFALFPAISALGADSLNNGGSSLLAMVGLTAIAMAAVTLVILRNRVPRWLWTWAIFCISLSMLWATSLRGWYITGHDIQVEYYVFKLTDATKFWSMSHFQDAYNACLSITILPTVLKSLTGIDAVILYKVFYQVMFAAFTTGVFVLSRRFANKAVAFVAAFVFITFPTFITDMPMLNRQEMAFGFFTLLLLTIFNSHLSVKVRRILVVLLGIGTVVSHYSTTFVAIGLLLGGYILLLPLRRLLNKSETLPSFRAVTIGPAAVLVIGTIIWTGMYTKTGNNITGTVAAAAKSLPTILSAKSNNDNNTYALVKGKSPTPQQQLNQYSASQYQLTAGPVAQAGGHYPNFALFPVTANPQPLPPLTPVGQAMAKIGVAPHLLISTVKTYYGLGLQVMVLVGAILALLYRRAWKLSLDFIVLAPVGVILLAVQVVLPVIDYGLLRMLQQDMIFLSLPIVLAAMQIMGWMKIRSKDMQLMILTTIFAIVFLFLSGVVNQVTGGGEAQLAVSNSGFYYDAYYTDGSDLAMYSWLKHNYPMGYPINSDRFSRVKIVASDGITTVDGLAPSSLSKASYVVLSNGNITNNTVAMYFNGQLLFYKTPTDFLNTNKNLLYSNSDNLIYH